VLFSTVESFPATHPVFPVKLTALRSEPELRCAVRHVEPPSVV
jgi:hypothetical protein